MFDWIKLYLIAAVTFLALDFAWLLFIARKLYQEQLGGLLGETRIVPAVIFYLLYLAGIIYFVVNPAIEKESLSYAIMAGGFLGLLCYGTYDLTNLSTLKDWPILITSLDLVWGTFVTASTSGITYFITQWINGR